MKGNISKAVFFDRDGTLCRDANYLNRWEDFELLPGIERLAELKDMGFLLIGVTNQSGIARGIIKESFVKEVNGLFMGKYGFDAFYYCPHHPDEGCQCRKPGQVMAQRAHEDFGIDFSRSYMVGDKPLDIEFGRRMGAAGCILIDHGGAVPGDEDFIASGLGEAIGWILSDARGGK